MLVLTFFTARAPHKSKSAPANTWVYPRNKYEPILFSHIYQNFIFATLGQTVQLNSFHFSLSWGVRVISGIIFMYPSGLYAVHRKTLDLSSEPIYDF